MFPVRLPRRFMGIGINPAWFIWYVYLTEDRHLHMSFSGKRNQSRRAKAGLIQLNDGAPDYFISIILSTRTVLPAVSL